MASLDNVTSSSSLHSSIYSPSLTLLLFFLHFFLLLHLIFLWHSLHILPLLCDYGTWRGSGGWGYRIWGEKCFFNHTWQRTGENKPLRLVHCLGSPELTYFYPSSQFILCFHFCKQTFTDFLLFFNSYFIFLTCKAVSALTK